MKLFLLGVKNYLNSLFLSSRGLKNLEKKLNHAAFTAEHFKCLEKNSKIPQKQQIFSLGTHWFLFLCISLDFRLNNTMYYTCNSCEENM